MPFVIAASREYLKRCGVPQSPADLSQHDSIMIGNGQSWALAGLNDDIEVPARVVLRFGSMRVAVAHAVAAGMGLASLPRSVFEESEFTDVLCPVLTGHPLRQPHVYAIYVSRKPAAQDTHFRGLLDRAGPYTAALGHRGDSLSRRYFASVELLACGDRRQLRLDRWSGCRVRNGHF
jgi:DNA-binding transcriptional LysR family regulator